MVRLVHGRILVQPGIGHDPVDKVVDHRGDVVDAAEAVIQRPTLVGLHRPLQCLRGDARIPYRRAPCAGQSQHNRVLRPLMIESAAELNALLVRKRSIGEVSQHRPLPHRLQERTWHTPATQDSSQQATRPHRGRSFVIGHGESYRHPETPLPRRQYTPRSHPPSPRHASAPAVPGTAGSHQVNLTPWKLKVAISYVCDLLVRMFGGKATPRRRYEINSVRPTRTESQKLAETMRRLPGHYADRIASRALRRITSAAAAGQWERAVDQLITALRFGSAPVTAGERDELHAVLQALDGVQCADVAVAVETGCSSRGLLRRCGWR
jgi:hypothetical protein